MATVDKSDRGKRMKLTSKQIQDIIDYQIVVDCYSEDEANMGWANYMSENIHYPFTAKYRVRKRNGTSFWKEVTVIGSETGEDNFEGREYYVEIEIAEMIVPARLDELRNIQADEKTLETLQIWRSEFGGI
ncbi:MAG: calcium-binding protein [Chitinophagales bacterium]